jgi:hypothetical protein
MEFTPNDEKRTVYQGKFKSGKKVRQRHSQVLNPNRPVREGVSKGEVDGRRLPALWASHPPNGRKAVWGVAHPQGV